MSDEQLAKPLEVGETAPDFNLENQFGEKISLSQFRGKKNVVIYFYPKALTPGCTTQACGIRDTKEDYLKRDTVVFGMSPDPVNKLLKFKEKHDLNFDLLSDEEHVVADKYGVWGLKKFMGREFMGINRVSFVVGKDGLIKHVMSKVKTKTHHEDILAVLDNL